MTVSGGLSMVPPPIVPMFSVAHNIRSLAGGDAHKEINDDDNNDDGNWPEPAVTADANNGRCSTVQFMLPRHILAMGYSPHAHHAGSFLIDDDTRPKPVLTVFDGACSVVVFLQMYLGHDRLCLTSC